MSEFGLKITNYQAGSIHEYNLGVRDRYEYTPAMLSNSLFLDFLKENGLSVYKDRSTRDVICIRFDYGSSSYEESIKKLENAIKKAAFKNEKKKIKQLQEVKESKEDLKDKFEKLSKEELRTKFYKEGVSIDYISRNKDGEIRKKETIHYKFLYRTPGKAKKGERMFIREELYETALDYLRMGIKLPDHNAPIVEIEAYASLTTSSIVDRIQLNPENMLIIKDVDSPFVTDVISIETNEDKECMAVQKSNYTLKNVMFDGQALIESSLCPSWVNGYILLRHHFCKMAAFKSNIQLFFKDYFGDDYENAKVVDMFGNEHYAKDIVLITTENAVKWYKFDVSYEYWCGKVHQNNDMFGIVKTAHGSKFGKYQRMSYQMVNALDTRIMDDVMSISVEYIIRLKKDNEEFLNYLRDNYNYANDFEALVALCEQDPDFERSEHFRERKKDIIKGITSDFYNGRLFQNADNLVIVGSPYAMLLHSVGEDVHKDDTFCHEDGTIQCFTKRFDDNEYLAEFRSPFNGRFNLGYLHNVYSDKMFRYFDFDENIIAVNMIGTDFQSMNNGLS